MTRNLWSYVIIFCGHFPDGALHFTEEEIEDETRAEWYLRQMLGSANFEGGPLLHILSRQPRLPDRAPPLPGPAEQPLRRDLGARCASCARSTTSPTRPARCTGSTARRCARSSSCRCPTRWTSSDQPEPPTPPLATAAQVRRRAARRGSASSALVAAARRGVVTLTEAVPGPRRARGSPSARCRGSAAAARCRWAARSPSSARRRRWPATPSTCRRCTWRARRSCALARARTRRWQLVTTSGFEFVRPTREDLDQEPRFEPNSLL